MRSALVCGAGGFIGGHLVTRLKSEGFWVRGVDLKYHEYAVSPADDFLIGDLRDPYFCRQVVDRRFDEVYQLAADMGGAGFIFVGDNDADIMHNSGMVNFNVLDACQKRGVERIFYSSSACMYPAYNQIDPQLAQLRREFRVSGRARQRIRMGEAFQRAALSCLFPLSRDQGQNRPLPQHFRPRGHLERRAREGAGRLMPQSRRSP